MIPCKAESNHEIFIDRAIKSVSSLIKVRYIGSTHQFKTGIYLVKHFIFPMGTNCAPLLADLFLYSYEAEFIQWLVQKGETKLAQSFNFTFRFIDDVLTFCLLLSVGHLQTYQPYRIR